MFSFNLKHIQVNSLRHILAQSKGTIERGLHTVADVFAVAKYQKTKH